LSSEFTVAAFIENVSTVARWINFSQSKLLEVLLQLLPEVEFGVLKSCFRDTTVLVIAFG
jgi:hypothetical protein